MGSDRKKLCPRLICRYQYQGKSGVLCGQEDVLLDVCAWEMDGGCDPEHCPALSIGRGGPDDLSDWPRAPRMERMASLVSYFRRLLQGGARR